MRKIRENQPPLSPIWPEHRLSDELRTISRILDENPEIPELILHDLSDKRDTEKGSPGLSADQVMRCAVLKNWQGFSYERLAFHLSDSMSFAAFCRLPMGWAPGKSCLQENIGRIRAETWERIREVLVRWGRDEGLEKGETVRVDATPVAGAILHPTDSRLLCDCIRVVTRLLKRLGKLRPETAFADHTRRARRRCTNIRNSRGKALKRRHYRDLLKTARKTWGYGEKAVQECFRRSDPGVAALTTELRGHLGLMRRVIDQTERRVLRGEKVPAADKLVSIFEPHADILQCGGRETVFGHKVFLTCGKTSLITDCRVMRGNPADSNQTRPMLLRHRALYGSFPRQASFDGGFASRENLQWAKNKAGIQDVAFAKKCGLKVSDMVRSSWIYKQLRRLRAGIEGIVSMLKRVFGADRCTWKGWKRFRRYVHLSVVSFDLLVLARLKLAQ